MMFITLEQTLYMTIVRIRAQKMMPIIILLSE